MEISETFPRVFCLTKWRINENGGNKQLIKPGRWNIPEHGIIIIIMKKVCKIKFSAIKLNKIKLASAWKIKRKKNRTKHKHNKTNSN